MKKLRAMGTIDIPVYSLDESYVIMHISVQTHNEHGEVKVTWTFFDNVERHEEIHADLPTALLRVGVLMSTTEDERVREYRGTPNEFARRARDFVVTTTV